jgi:hypothetical protein
VVVEGTWRPVAGGAFSGHDPLTLWKTQEFEGTSNSVENERVVDLFLEKAGPAGRRMTF